MDDIRRRCRRAGSYLALVAFALIATSRSHTEAPASAMTPFALPKLPALRAPEAPALPVPTGRFAVRVTSAGKPIADAIVSLADGSGAAASTAHTDAAGLAELTDLRPGAYEVWAAHGTLVSPLARVASLPAAPIELVLEPAGAVRGEVIVDGALPSGASVQLVPIDRDHAARVAALDERGRFALDAMPPGRWRVEPSVPGHVPNEEQVVELAARESSLVVRMQRAGTVSGTVVDENGAPVANATIVLREQVSAVAQADAHGHSHAAALQAPFTIEPSRVRWIHPLASTRLMPVIPGARYGAGRSGPRPAECGRGHCGVDLGEERGSTVHASADGVVAAIFPEPRTEAGRLVAIHHGGGLKSMYMHLDAIRPGLEVGQPIRAGDPVGTLGMSGILRSAPHLHFAITYERLGRTWYLDPEPVLRHAVVLPEPRTLDPIDAAAPPALAEPAETPTVAPVLVTDARGAFTLDGIAPGSYVAVAFAPDYPPAASGQFAIRSAEPTTGIAITLRPGAMVVGRVVGRDGPIAGASVFAGAGFGETAHKVATTGTDRTGEFMLRSLAGKITLTVTAPGYGEVERTIVVDEREASRRREDFVLMIENAELRGQVLAPDGGAAAGVSVRVVEGITRRRAITDAQGRFALTPLASGRYVLELSSPDFPTKRITTQSDRFSEIKLDTGGGARVVLRDAQSGEPLAGARVELVGPAGQSASRTTDARGVLELRGLAVGEWKLDPRVPGFVGNARSIAIRAQRVLQDVTIELARGATIAGVVRDRYGRRVAGARVTLGGVSASTDGEGEFRLTGVASGTLEAEYDGRRASQPLRLAPGDERLSLAIELPE